MPRYAIDALRYRDDFVRELPGDLRTDDPRPRPVLGACYSHVRPTPVSAPVLLALVPEVAALLELDPTPTRDLVDTLAGNRIAPLMRPYAACYGGHQFGSWAGQLGDGRAITLAEVQNDRGESWEIQLKGAGPTPYSRHADGRAVLRSSLRELVCSEAMHHLGVPTTRALSLVATGDGVMRDFFYDGHPRLEPGAIACRVAPSFLRFGSYEIHAARRDTATLARLVDFTRRRYYPEIAGDGPDAIAAMFAEICRRTAALAVEWTRVGFVHGVLNTDNMSILGLTIDYGPYGWVEPFDLDWTPNTTDAEHGRYRFGQQGQVAMWNLVQLGNAWVPLVGAGEPLQRGIELAAAELERGFRRMMLDKLGLRPTDTAADDATIGELVGALSSTEVDMTRFFRGLSDLPAVGVGSELAISALLDDAEYAPPRDDALRAWLVRYLARVAVEGEPRLERAARMRRVNPRFVPRNYLVQEVIDRVESTGDASALTELLDVLRHPYDEQPGREAYAAKRPEWARNRAGCSMLS